MLLLKSLLIFILCEFGCELLLVDFKLGYYSANSSACQHSARPAIMTVLGEWRNLAGGPPSMPVPASMPVQVAAVCMLIFFFFVTDQWGFRHAAP